MALVPGWSVIAPPQSVITPSPFVLRPKEKLSMCGLYREQYAANKYRQESRIGRSGIDAPEDTFRHSMLPARGGFLLYLSPWLRGRGNNAFPPATHRQHCTLFIRVLQINV